MLKRCEAQRLNL